MRNIKYIFYSGFIFFLQGCYIVSPQVSPLVVLDKKGDLQADMGISISSQKISALGGYASCAYAVTDNSFIQFSTSKIITKDFEYNAMIGQDFNFDSINKFGIGIGYKYSDISSSTTESTSLDNIWTFDWDGKYRLPYTKLQWINKRNKITFGLGTSIGIFMPNLYKEDRLINDNGLYIEPSFSFIIPRHNRRLDFALNSSYLFILSMDSNIDNLIDYNKISYNKFIVGIGLYYRFNINSMFENNF